MRPAGLTRTAKDDLDLHIVTPSRKEICYSHPKSRCGGELDVDANRDEATARVDPVENMFWPTGKAPIGHFAIKINLYTRRSGQAYINFKVQESQWQVTSDRALPSEVCGVQSDLRGEHPGSRGPHTYEFKPQKFEHVVF